MLDPGSWGAGSSGRVTMVGYVMVPALLLVV